MRGRCASSAVATSVAPFGENGVMSTRHAHRERADERTAGTAPEAASGTANVPSAASVPSSRRTPKSALRRRTTRARSARRLHGVRGSRWQIHGARRPQHRDVGDDAQMSTTCPIDPSDAGAARGRSTNASAAPNVKHNTRRRDRAPRSSSRRGCEQRDDERDGNELIALEGPRCRGRRWCRSPPSRLPKGAAPLEQRAPAERQERRAPSRGSRRPRLANSVSEPTRCRRLRRA